MSDERVWMIRKPFDGPLDVHDGSILGPHTSHDGYFGIVEVVPLAALERMRAQRDHMGEALGRIATHDWTEPPSEMPDEMARAALDSLDSAGTSSPDASPRATRPADLQEKRA